jgi:hypothetical protein
LSCGIFAIIALSAQPVFHHLMSRKGVQHCRRYVSILVCIHVYCCASISVFVIVCRAMHALRQHLL